MRAVQKFETAEFDEGNVATGEFHFQRAAMMRGPKQHRLLLEPRANLAILQHPLSDVTRLAHLVAHADELRTLCRLTSSRDFS
jgi:hypothetical protein